MGIDISILLSLYHYTNNVDVIPGWDSAFRHWNKSILQSLVDLAADVINVLLAWNILIHRDTENTIPFVSKLFKF